MSHRTGAVLVTGAAGGIGQLVVAELVDAGLTVLATDRVDRPAPGAAARLVGDLRDPGFVAECFNGPAAIAAGGVDAVVHLAAIPAPGIVPEHETLQGNTTSAYLVFTEAGRHGVRRVVASSSFSAVGLAWADRDLSPHYVPVDERHPSLTVDSYGLSKTFTEEIAAFTTRRFGVSTVCLRFPFAGTGERLRERLDAVRRDPAGNRRDLWAWVDSRDVARAAHAAVTADLTGHHVLNIAAADTTTAVPTRELLHRYHPAAAVRADLTDHQSLIDIRLAETVLGFAPVHGWRPDPGGNP
ncbi:NAD-dependent epimerase/dehydratase family protein [Dactylosporangium siamense]|uniref:NAD-dependent epimerase n=1 Tax=Dactylosporangium siamense TaxID=685454 RepID=A0A919PJU7_9ACTN|nr:NAD(P)-dependent oxidoreductase [Dactylosporangium siamense]GIG43820.1 NAD-dependent epimerase [Dactylosporangium siamense]